MVSNMKQEVCGYLGSVVVTCTCLRRLLLHGVGEWVSRQRPGHAERESGSPVEYRSTQFDIHLRQSRLSVYVTIK